MATLYLDFRLTQKTNNYISFYPFLQKTQMEIVSFSKTTNILFFMFNFIFVYEFRVGTSVLLF